LGVPTVDPAFSAGPAATTLPAAAAGELTVAAALTDALAEQVAQVSAGPDGQLQLHFASGATAVLGTTDGLADKLSALVTMLAKVRIGKTVIDVRVPSAPVLTQTASGQ
jgi:hypothetical protein